MMKHQFLLFFLLGLAPAVMADHATVFSSSAFAAKLHENRQRGQLLVFVPDEPGEEVGKWRISWESGAQVAELLISEPIPLPDFKTKLRIELDAACSPGTSLRSADLRLLDSGGEVCPVNRISGENSGEFTLAWEIARDGTFPVSWGKNLNRRLDQPAGISNFAFILNEPGDLTLSKLRFIPDPPAKQ